MANETLSPTRKTSSHAYISEEMVSSYLKKNTDFLLRWLSENATKEIVEVFAKKLKEKNWDDDVEVKDTKTTVRKKMVGLRETSEKTVGGTLDPFSSTARNSITSQIFRRYLDGDRTRKATVRKDRTTLQRMSEEELFMELIRDIASELDVNLLCHKIIQNVSILTNSDRGSLFLVRGSRENKHLVSKLFDVTETSTLEDAIHTERNEIKVPFGKGIVGLVAQSGRPINIKDAYEDPRFNQEIDRQTGYRTHSILSMPIANYEGEVIGVAQIINKISGNHEFSTQDEELFRKYLIFCGIGITNAQLFEMSVNEFKRNQLLLHLARGIFEEQTNLEKLVQKIMLDAQELLKCEKCCVYLLEDTCERDPAAGPVDTKRPKQTPSGQNLPVGNTYSPEHKSSIHHKSPDDVVFSKAFDLCAKDGTVTVPAAQVLASSKTAYIAKFVVTTGEPVNVQDLDVDGRFGVGPFVDTSGSRIRSVLCMPIHNSEKQIIGVTQLINKMTGEPFNDNDVNIIEAFSIFTGLGIHNCQMYENACQLMAKQSVALEVLSFHATAPVEEAQSLTTAKIPPADQLRLYTFDFDDLTLDDEGTLKACVRMFMEADIINKFKVPYEVVCRWVCTVKKNYRPVTYHNWRHAFNVCQTMFTMLFTGELKPLFEDLEVFTLLAACLCHDLDHRGTNNAFQVKVASPLAMLYSTSVLEHHHFDHCIMILNSEGNNIFQSLSPDEYRRAIKLLEHAILSTDLALYFKKRGDFKKIVESGEKTFEDQNKRALLRAMMMTACDVGAITKPWSIQQETAQLVTAEFFEQGDIERHQLGEQPIPMMDRNKKDELPKMQVGFIDAICAPVYKLFSVINPRLDPLYDGCESNREKWQELAEQHDAAAKQEEEKLKEKSQNDKDDGPSGEGKERSTKTDSQSGGALEQAGPARDPSSTTSHQQQNDTLGPTPQDSARTLPATSPQAANGQDNAGGDKSSSNSSQGDPHSNRDSSAPSNSEAKGEATMISTSQPSHSSQSLLATSSTSHLHQNETHKASIGNRDSHARNITNSDTHSSSSTTQEQQQPAACRGDSQRQSLHQNGCTAANQRESTSNGGQHSPTKKPPASPKDTRGKRKTHAQAHAQAQAAAGDKPVKKSGVCNIS